MYTDTFKTALKNTWQNVYSVLTSNLDNICLQIIFPFLNYTFYTSSFNFLDLYCYNLCQLLCSGSFSSQGIFYSPVTVEYFFKVMPMEMKKNQVKWETRTTKAFTVGRPAIEAKTLLFLIIFLNIKKKYIFFYRKCIS